MDKKQLRAEIRKSIALLDESYLAYSDAEILRQFAGLSEFISARQIFCYWSMGREVDTHRLIELAVSQGKRIALPHVLPEGIMIPVVSDGRLTRRLYGIPEPENLTEARLLPGDIVVVPALAFDENGYRLGQGGGYYDRFLKNCGLVSVGLAREKLLCAEVPRDANDMRVDFVVTEKKIRGFC